MLDRTLVLDTETTGLNPDEDRLVELAAIHVSTDQYYSKLCNPGRGIPPEAMAVHHITEEMVATARDPGHVTSEMLQTLGYPEIIVAHNAKFDKGFMRKIWASTTPVQWICTYRCALLAWPEAPRHTNQVLRYWLGLKPNPDLLQGLAPHRALYDIIITREIFRALCSKFSLEEMIQISNNPILLPIVTFGKHKGKKWSEVDYGYLRWCCQQPDMDEDVLHTAQHYMRKR